MPISVLLQGFIYRIRSRKFGPADRNPGEFLANTPQARKRIRQNSKRNERNSSNRSKLRTLVKKTRASIEAGNEEDARANFREATAYLDRQATRGLIHKNKAARTKSRLSQAIKNLAA